jgi:hypothetical protein
MQFRARSNSPDSTPRLSKAIWKCLASWIYRTKTCFSRLMPRRYSWPGAELGPLPFLAALGFSRHCRHHQSRETALARSAMERTAPTPTVANRSALTLVNSGRQEARHLRSFGAKGRVYSLHMHVHRRAVLRMARLLLFKV